MRVARQYSGQNALKTISQPDFHCNLRVPFFGRNDKFILHMICLLSAFKQGSSLVLLKAILRLGC